VPLSHLGHPLTGRIEMIQPTNKKQELFFNNLEHKNSKYKIAHQFLKSEKVYYIYFLINYDQIVYIGKSINYQARITAHNFEYNLIRVIKTNKKLADKWEIKLIRKYQPINNKDGIESYKTYVHSNRRTTNYFVKIRKYNVLKSKLNIKFKQTYIKDFYYRGKDSRNFYYNFEDFVKKIKAKFWSLDHKRLHFYTYKPKEDCRKIEKIYPISKKLEEIQ
jgi:hypothetical protein